MTSAIVGYARTSTTDQTAGLEAQLRDLEAVGCHRIFKEQLSSVDTKRPELERALDYVREGDTLVVTKLDRLARSMAHLVEITGRLKAKGVELKVLALQRYGDVTASGLGDLARKHLQHAETGADGVVPFDIIERAFDFVSDQQVSKTHNDVSLIIIGLIGLLLRKAVKEGDGAVPYKDYARNSSCQETTDRAVDPGNQRG